VQETTLRVVVDDLRGPRIAAFLEAHLEQMRATSPPESKHALDLDGLRRPEVVFWTLLDGEEVVGCAALKALDATHAEVKSMRTHPERRRQGLGALLLAHVVEQARLRGFTRLSLETGSAPFFAPARAMYARAGFVGCPPFADYVEDPHSVFMTLRLE
jgi:putative acetyltransferase